MLLTTIRVYRVSLGRIDTVDFRSYVKHVLLNEWIASWNGESLRAGAMASKTYGWYRTMHAKYPGLGYDTKDTTADQVYNPNVSYASTNAAIDDTWNYRLARNGADGVAGPTTWKNLIWHFEYADLSANICDQDPAANGNANWGVAATVAQLEKATGAFAGLGYGRVPLGDIGFEHGGDIPDHNAHEKGIDADSWPIRTDRAQCSAGRITWQSPTYDRAATRELIKAIGAAAPSHVDVIFFNDPVLINEGLTTSYPNHDNHLHVRYK